MRALEEKNGNGENREEDTADTYVLVEQTKLPFSTLAQLRHSVYVFVTVTVVKQLNNCYLSDLIGAQSM